jgi:hypothetical protein
VAKYSFILFLFLWACDQSASENKNDLNWYKNVKVDVKPNGIEVYNGSSKKIHYHLIKANQFNSLKDTFKGIPNDSTGLSGTILAKDGYILNRFKFENDDSLTFVFWDKNYADPSNIPRIDFQLF